jgi:hypothetical protein
MATKRKKSADRSVALTAPGITLGVFLASIDVLTIADGTVWSCLQESKTEMPST